MHSNLVNLRERIRQKRRALSRTDKIKSAKRIVHQLIQDPILSNSHKIAGYFSSDGEVDLISWFQEAWKQSKQCYLPVVVGRELAFGHYTPTTKLQPNRWNILEPVTNQMIHPSELDAAILPIVAFDINGNRMGRGSGYYDRSFSFMKGLSPSQDIYLVGVAYAFQQYSQLIPNRWDIPMHAVITELATLNCTS